MYMASSLCRRAVLFVLTCFSSVAVSAHTIPSGMQAMQDHELSMIAGQAGSLFLADTIYPNELENPNPDGYSNFTFHRMGLDARLDFNINISKLQLGCGGVNDALTGPGCDIDIDYVSFMGINAAGDRPSPDGPESMFEMVRPYFELAVKNDNTPNREIVGIKVGAQRVNGALGIGRLYDMAVQNMENGGVCDPSASSGSGVLNCNSGINSISGFLSLEMSAGFEGRARIWPYNVNLRGCLGRLNPAYGQCGPNTTPFFVEAGGTRLDVLHAAAARLQVDAISLNCAWWDLACWTAQGFANLIVDGGYGQLVIDTRLLHFLTVPDTENFFLSFQREPVAYPNYSKGRPPDNVLFDICNPAYGQRTARCSSGYSPPANSGWWLNAPGAKLLNIMPDGVIDVGDVSWGEALSLFGPGGRLIIENPKLDLFPGNNCWGSAQFC